MKSIVINNSMHFIAKNNPIYDQIQLEKIKYGLETLYILITKVSVILLIGFFLNIFKELIVFLVIYNIIKLPSFGLHARNGNICLIVSTVGFIIATYASLYVNMDLFIKSIIGIICIILIFKNAPADTHKRPIVNKKRREIYKILSTLTAITFCIITLFYQNNFISNTLIFSLIIQVILTAPTTYKLFNLPYNNYKEYQKGV